MAGISDAALGKLNSQNKFNGGSELEEDYGVNLYSTFYRRYDPQIGRFSGVDIKSEASVGMSVYQFGGNNPVSMNDPLGDKQTAGLYGGSNGYYNFNPGYHSHDGAGDFHFANPNDGPDWMNSGDDGGGGGNSINWGGVLYEVSHGKELTEFKKVERQVFNYSQVDGPYSFETPNNDGLTTNQEDGKYYFTGISTNISYEVRGNSSGEENKEGGGFEKFNEWVGISTGFVENFGSGSVGSNFKVYENAWRGNQYVETFRVAETARALGWVSLGLGTLMDIHGMAVYKHNPNLPDAVSPAHASINAGFGLVGMWGGPVGWTISGIYFGVQATIGWNQAMQGVEMMDKSKMQLINSGIMTYSDFKY